MKPDTILRAACTGLAIALSACTSPGGTASPAGGEPAGRPGMVISVGSFDLPESVLLATLNTVSALLDTGTLRALDARVEIAGHNVRSGAQLMTASAGLRSAR